MPAVPPKDILLALFLGLLACVGTAFIFTIVFAVAGIWLDGHNYSWHHNEFRFGSVQMSVFDILMTLSSSSAGLITGISIIRTRKR